MSTSHVETLDFFGYEKNNLDPNKIRKQRTRMKTER